MRSGSFSKSAAAGVNKTLEYTLGIIALLFLSVAIFKLKIALVSFIYGVVCIGIAAAQGNNPDIAFTPLLQIALALIGVLLAFYAVKLYKGMG